MQVSGEGGGLAETYREQHRQQCQYTITKYIRTNNKHQHKNRQNALNVNVQSQHKSVQTISINTNIDKKHEMSIYNHKTIIKMNKHQFSNRQKHYMTICNHNKTS